MMQFTVKGTPTIEGPQIIRPNSFGEPRPWLADITSTESIAGFEAMGLTSPIVAQMSEIMPRGVIRGLHFQRKDSYGRLVGVAAGRILAVAVDLRPESLSFGAANSIELSAENEAMLYIPPYFAFGFMTLEAASEVVISGDGQIDADEESGIIYDDEILAIDWQFERYEIDSRRLNISQRDKKNPSFRSYNQNSLWINRPKKSKYALSRRPVPKKF